MLRSLRDGDEPFTEEGMSKYFPYEDILEGEHYQKCAIVSSAGSMKGSQLGSFIGETHRTIKLVVRFGEH